MKISKEISRAMFLYISFSVLGPLLVIGGVGYIVDKIFNNKFILFFSIFVAYIVSNVLMFKKLKKINQEIENIGEEKEAVGNIDDLEEESLNNKN